MKTVPAKTILQRNKSASWFGTDYNMNLYRGCCHGCIYCDSRSSCYGIERFDEVCAKENALQILRDELRRKIRSGIVGTGAMGDPYNPFEREELLTRHALELISAYGFGAAVQTKSALIVRDSDVFMEIAEHSPVLCNITVTCADDELCRKLEPRVSSASERFDAVARLTGEGLFAGITMMPVLPFIEDSDENITAIIRSAHECGARFIYPSFGVTLRDDQREYYYRKLDEITGDDEIKNQYIRRYGDRYYCTSPRAEKLWKLFTAECDRYGILYNMKDIISAYKLGYEDSQLSFF